MTLKRRCYKENMKKLTLETEVVFSCKSQVLFMTWFIPSLFWVIINFCTPFSHHFGVMIISLILYICFSLNILCQQTLMICKRRDNCRVSSCQRKYLHSIPKFSQFDLTYFYGIRNLLIFDNCHFHCIDRWLHFIWMAFQLKAKIVFYWILTHGFNPY